MRLRIGIVALVLGLVSTGVTWLSLQPTITFLIGLAQRTAAGADPQVQRVYAYLPFSLALDLALSTGVIFLILYFTIAAPIARAEETIARISRLDVDVPLSSGGPVATRLQQALQRLAEALQAERARNKQQLESLRQANEELVRLQSELVASDRLATVGKLAAGVAHEVGNPLAGILGYLSVARMVGKAEPELLDLVQRIEHEVQRIDQIVRSLLELGRPSRGKAGPLAVRTVLDSCVQLLAAGREFKDVRLTVDCDPGLYLSAESGPLSQVVVNLLINAAQAMGEKGEISLSAGTRDGRGFIAVRDHGPGIPPEIAARLFEPFFTTKPAGRGTGLGLAVSRHLLAQFAGDLEAANAEGGGAVFTISLPVP